MEGGVVVLIVVGMIALVIIIRLCAGGMDDDRVRNYIEQQGGQLLSKEWQLFGRGWFGSPKERIYLIRFLDRDGNEHEASCKTNYFAGVYVVVPEKVYHPLSD